MACAPTSALRLESTELYAAGEAPSFVLADTNGDSVPDLITRFDGPLDRGVTVRRGSIDGSFGGAQRVLVGAISLATFDLGKDGSMDLVVGDGQHLGVLAGGHGPFRVIGASREHVLGAIEDGVLTTNGEDLMLHAWELELTRSIEVAPLLPMTLAELDGDGLSDVIGIAHGQAAIRHGTNDGFGPVHLLRESDGVAIADVDGNGVSDVLTWARNDGFAWRGDGFPIAGFPVPSDVTAITAGDLDSDGHPEIVVASHAEVRIVGRGPIDGLWRDVRQLAVDDRGRIVIADASSRTIAVVQASSLSMTKERR